MFNRDVAADFTAITWSRPGRFVDRRKRRNQLQYNELSCFLSAKQWLGGTSAG
jgi:hypothetical protein